LSALWTGLQTSAARVQPSQQVGSENRQLGPQLAARDERLHIARLERCAELSLAATTRALHHAQIPKTALASRAGAVLGCSPFAEPTPRAAAANGPDQRLPALSDFGSQAAHGRALSRLADGLGLGGPVLLNAPACASGSAALAWGYELI